MTQRVAEFLDSDDAYLFMTAKNREAGEEAYTVCGGLHMNWSVRPKSRREIGGRPFEPAESWPEPQEYDDE